MLIKDLINALNAEPISSFIRSHRKALLISTIFGVCASVFQLLGFYCLILLLKTNNWIYFYLVLASWSICAISFGSSSYYAHDAERKISLSLKKGLVKHLSLLPSQKRSRYDETFLKRLLREDVHDLHHTIAHLPAELCTFFVLPVLSLILMLSLSGAYAILTIIPACLASIYYLWIVPKTTARDGEARMQVMRDIISAVDDYCRGIKINRIYGQSTGALQTYLTSAQNFTKNMSFWVKKVATLAAIATAFLQPVATLTIAYYVSRNDDFIALASTLFFSLAFIAPVLKLGHGLDYINLGIQAAKRIIDFLSLQSLSGGTLKKYPIDDQPIDIHIKKLKLNIDTNSVNQVTMTCLANEVSTLVGPSGCGKSTLLKTLVGFEDLPPNSVFLNQLDISELDKNYLHFWICMMPQSLTLMSGSIRNNLNIFRPNFDLKKLNNILDIFEIDYSLDTSVNKLSGGERQRLLIAITLLSPAPIILMDEPTSALDSHLSSTIIKFIKQYASDHNKTILIVTHDQDIANLADRVYDFDNFLSSSKEDNI